MKPVFFLQVSVFVPVLLLLLLLLLMFVRMLAVSVDGGLPSPSTMIMNMFFPRPYSMVGDDRSATKSVRGRRDWRNDSCPIIS